MTDLSGASVLAFTDNQTDPMSRPHRAVPRLAVLRNRVKWYKTVSFLLAILVAACENGVREAPQQVALFRCRPPARPRRIASAIVEMMRPAL